MKKSNHRLVYRIFSLNTFWAIAIKCALPIRNSVLAFHLRRLEIEQDQIWAEVAEVIGG
jgi:hypothetical protein